MSRRRGRPRPALARRMDSEAALPLQGLADLELLPGSEARAGLSCRR